MCFWRICNTDFPNPILFFSQSACEVRSTLWALQSFVHSQVLSLRQEELLEAALAVFWPTHEGLLSQGNQSTLQRHRNGTPQGFVLRCCNNMPKKHISFPQYWQSQLGSVRERINNFSPEFHGNLAIYRDLPGEQIHPQKLRANCHY